MALLLRVVGLLVAALGLIAIGFGIPIKEFGTGNMMIGAGVVAIGSGLIVFALGAILAELNVIAASLETPVAPAPVTIPSPSPAPAPPRPARSELFAPDDAEAAPPDDLYAADVPDAPWHRREAPLGREASLNREASLSREAAMPPAARRIVPHTKADLAKADRDRAPPAQESAAGDDRQAAEPIPPQPNLFESLWPARRDPSAPARHDETQPVAAGETAGSAEAAASPPPAADAAVTVIKSGVIDGMAYSLFSDGSIEAELADGVIHFDSLDALKAHLDRA